MGEAVKRWMGLLFAAVGLLAAILFWSIKTHSSLGFEHLVELEFPPEVEVESIAYACYFDRRIAESELRDEEGLPSTFAIRSRPVESNPFTAVARGHRTTRLGGWVVDSGRESVIVIRLEADDGRSFLGIADLPRDEMPVKVELAESE